MTTTLKEQIERVTTLLPTKSVESLPNAIQGKTQLQMQQEALNRLIEERAPVKYAACRPEDVPQLLPGICKGKGLVLLGNPGIGKTYAATAAARMYITARYRLEPNASDGSYAYPASALIWTTAPRLLTRVRSTMGAKAKESAMDIMEEYDKAFVVILDDYGAEKPSDYSAEILYDMLTGRLNDNRFTIITSNLDMGAIAVWRPNIASRLSEMAEITLPDRDWRLIKKYQCA